ncbi:MAG: hypothetical protein UV82_C0016G0003 [Candidatus Magasanikbacteria bacterium GW2011_GWD2_43_18]|nr:MAG: hypothetical protein UV18_C0004G0081 [Candidatus Magasanikbacteria bacterium GW2011_GWC2_42_27]KKT03749.1 MAG: hypothetical protein UV82_C0016G0003 [Candidatus Magasanikbacteria bacterium GW2011_GWD2_43_18]KKT25457.1 MAG: hypothetical protein UW10_C0007G0030 [Candidatus Magasanikbacteria bacterium GW2011_GWA2_43_9]HBB38398.1 hypothetical protein [Candidatus Magasanikbacteria bacterium]HCC14165.1 hypothetical protein [Candidatus Magasanikbacteria bacterium]
MEEEHIANQPEEQEEILADTQNSPKEKKTRTNFLHTALMPLVFWIVFGGLFYFFSYDLAKITYADITDARITKLFATYSIFAGLALGFISMLGGYIVYGILKKTALKNYTLIFPVIAFLMTLPWYFLARQLVYIENKYTDMGRGLIYYIGVPLLSTTKFLFWVVALWTLILIVKKVISKNVAKKSALVASFLIAPLFLTGCVSNINEWACGFFDNPDHCLQNAAVQGGNPDTCKNIQGEDFSDSGSNPPKDKCYLRIAENTGDLGTCDNIEGGPYSYTKEECILNTSVKFKNPSGCVALTGADRDACIEQVSPSIHPGRVVEIDEQIEFLKKELNENPDAALQKQLDELEKTKADYMAVINDENKKEYESLTDPLNKQTALDYATGEIDEKTKNALTALNDSLREKGETLSEKEYKAISDMLAYKNDPKNDIENLEASELVKLRWNEKLGNAKDYLKFWNANPTEKEKKYDESLLIYERMLERQAAIDKGLSQEQQDFERETGRIQDQIKDDIIEKITDEAKKAAFGELLELVESDAAGATTAILGEALDTVQKEAKSAEFRGLVRAYNLGMEEELAKAGGDVDKAHAAVTANLQKDPYMYEDKNTFAKYGNILENKDCDGTNPHCVNKEVFWKAMKKSFTYQQQ